MRDQSWMRGAGGITQAALIDSPEHGSAIEIIRLESLQ